MSTFAVVVPACGPHLTEDTCVPLYHLEHFMPEADRFPVMCCALRLAAVPKTPCISAVHWWLLGSAHPVTAALSPSAYWTSSAGEWLSEAVSHALERDLAAQVVEADLAAHNAGHCLASCGVLTPVGAPNIDGVQARHFTPPPPLPGSVGLRFRRRGSCSASCSESLRSSARRL
jgi:hypothetical protein